MLRNFFAALLLLGLAFASTAQAAPKPQPEPAPMGQLPSTAEPLYYQLHFEVDPAKPRFSGDAVITVQLNTAADHLWLHGRALKVSAATLTDAAAKTFAVRYRQMNADGAARIDFGRRLEPQTISLHLVYSAAFSTSLEGLYRVQRGGEYYAMTQMEAVSARWAFPCFDEPRFKTRFALSLTLPKALFGVANTRPIDEQAAPGGQRKTLVFAATEKLPTYLIAFAVGPWEVSRTVMLEPNHWRGVPIPLRVMGPRGSGAGFDYVLEKLPAMVYALEDYFGMAYPYDKLDLLAAPDFANGAMENAGLITFLDSLILLDAKAALKARQDFVDTTVHELAHQWFGNLVTPRWWDEIWLNEAFATWMAAKISGQLHPEWPTELLQLQGTQAAMAADSLVSARRIREPVTSLEGIAAAFDSITYEKGAAVLANLESWVGAAAFRQGVHDYLVNHVFGNASADDLLNAVQKASGKGLAFGAAAHSFLDQAGLPLLQVVPSCENGKGSLALAQSRYLPLGSPGAAAGPPWGIPACFRIGRADGKSERACLLMSSAQDHLDLGACAAWVMPNAGAKGYYRFTLPTAEMARLATAMPQLSPAEQGAVGDAVAARFALGQSSVEEVLATLAATANARQPAVVTSLWPTLEFLRSHLLDAAGMARVRARLSAIYAPALARLGSTPLAGEPDDDVQLRVELFALLGVDWALPGFRAPLLAQGEAMLAASGADGPLALNTLASDQRPAVLAVLLQTQGAALLPRLLAELHSNSDPQQRAGMVYALGSLSDPALLPAVRAAALGEDLRFLEMTSLLRRHAAQPANTASFLPWYMANLGSLRKHFNSDNAQRLPRYAATGLCSAAEASALQAAFAPLLPGIAGGERALKQAQETVQICAALHATYIDLATK